MRMLILGRDVAASPLLSVEWPSIALVNVPTHLETYSNDIEIKAKFTTNLCSQMLVTPSMNDLANEHEKQIKSVSTNPKTIHKLPFETYLELISCPPPSRQGRYYTQTPDCQVN